MKLTIVFFFLLEVFTGLYVFGQANIENYIAFDQISLYDIKVEIDSTRVVEYEYDEFNLKKRHYTYSSLEAFKKDHYIDEPEVIIKTDSLSKTFELQVEDTFVLSSHPDIILEVIPNNMIRSHFKFDTDIPDAMNGCSLRFKKIKTENFSVT